MNVAVIPARGGSKRIEKKNIQEFAGRPIITYSIEAAVLSQLFDRIIVSTDDEQIADMACSLGADVPFWRPAELCGDFVGTGAVVKHALEWLAATQGLPDFVCCIYATAPLLKVDYLRDGFRQLEASTQSYSMSVTTYAFPIQRAVRLVDGKAIEPLFPQFRDYRSQDLEDAFHDAGQFYWGRPSAFLEDVPVLGSATIPIILPRHLVQDIDTPEDWRRAELMYFALKNSGELR